MKKIVLISCSSKKFSYLSKAKDLYTSSLFKYSLRYAQFLKPNNIFILSAKYGLLNINKIIKSYNVTLNKMSSEKLKKWSKSVLEKLEKHFNLSKDAFIFLAGNNYRKYLIPSIKHWEVPMEGLRIGEQLRWLKNKIGK